MNKLIKNPLPKRIIITLVLAPLISGVLSGCGGGKQEPIALSDAEINATAQLLASTSIAQTMQAIPATATVTSTATIAASATPMPSVIPSATEVLTRLTLEQTLNCRNGPGIDYMVLVQIEKDGTFPIAGRNESSTWLYIEPQDLDEGCWLFGSLVTIEGETEQLPVVVSLALKLIGNDPKFILFFLIAEDTGGTVACGDSLVAFNTGLLRSGDAAEDAKAAMRALLTIGSPYVSGYRHSGYQSNLQVVSAEYNAGSQVVTIYLSGTVIKPETNCDKERFRVQIFATAQQFDNVSKAFVWVGTVPIGDYLVQN